MFFCAIAGLVVLIAAFTAFGYPRGGIFLGFSILFLAGGIIASIVAAIVARNFNGWLDSGIPMAEQVNSDAVLAVLMVFVPSMVLGTFAFALWIRKMKLSNKATEIAQPSSGKKR